jgi:hypothetical protein
MSGSLPESIFITALRIAAQASINSLRFMAFVLDVPRAFASRPRWIALVKTCG